ncbi:hypothetical protein ABEB36_000291 [Hypothenemus hampei]|uniref:Uncharacterized protein n=1 Tax=Hypothenemus hampei TaxID=57062 RepID=A0ABD1FAR4_HYPHA
MVCIFLCILGVTAPVSAAYNIEITAGAFWKKLPESIPYEATIPLTYQTDWVETLFRDIPEDSIPCPSTEDTHECIIQHHIKALSRMFTQEIQILNDAYKIQYMYENQSTAVRHKCSLDFIGEGFSWCCGLATHQKLQLIEEDEAGIRRRLDSLTASLSGTFKTFLDDTRHFRQYEQQLKTTLNETERHIQLISHSLQGFQKRAFAAEKSQKRQIDFIARNEFHTIKQGITVTRLLHRQAILSACKEHKLPSSIVHPQVLQKDLLSLGKELQAADQKLAIPLADLFRYYKLSITECSFTSSKLFVLVKIPILRRTKTWELFELVTVPFAWYNQTCAIPHRSLYLAANKGIGSRKAETRQISGTGLHQCRPYHDRLCFIPHFSSDALEGPECARTLFQGGTVQEISQHCPLECHPSTTMSISEVLENTYILTHPKAPLYMVCNNITTRLPDQYKHQGSVKLKLDCSCHLETIGEILIPRRFPCSTTTEKPYYTHIIPALWSHFPALVLDVHEQHTLPTYSSMEGCLNDNWTLTIPHLNLTSHERILQDLQIRLQEAQVTQRNTTAITAHSFLLYWNIILTVSVIYLLLKINNAFLLLATLPPAKAELGLLWHDIHLSLVCSSVTIFTIFLLYYLGKTLIQRWRKTTPTRPENQQQEALSPDSLLDQGAAILYLSPEV